MLQNSNLKDLPAKTVDRWLILQASGNFEQSKADLSLMALPENRHAVKCSTIEAALKGYTPTLATVRKYHSEAMAVETIYEYLVAASQQITVGKSISPAALELTAEMILEKYHWLTLADIRAALSLAVSGTFGEMYDRFDTPTIFRWLNEFHSQRTELAEMESDIRHYTEKSRAMAFKEFVR